MKWAPHLDQFVALVSFATLCGANTEGLAFAVPKDSPLLDFSEPGLSVTPAQSVVGNATASFRIYVDAAPAKYFARLCWPASHPAEFALSYDAPYLEVGFERTAHALSDKWKNQPVPYELILSETQFGIPVDMYNTIVAVLATLVAAAALCRLLFWA